MDSAEIIKKLIVISEQKSRKNMGNLARELLEQIKRVKEEEKTPKWKLTITNQDGQQVEKLYHTIRELKNENNMTTSDVATIRRKSALKNKILIDHYKNFTIEKINKV